MPSLDDLGTKQVISGTPDPDDLIAYFDLSEFGNAPVKKTTVAALLGGAAGSTDTIATSDGSAAAEAGDLGELLEDNFGPISELTTDTPANFGSLSLTAGDWHLYGHALFSFTGADVTLRSAGISTVSETLPGAGAGFTRTIPATAISGSELEVVPSRNIRVTSTTTVYLVAQSNFSAGTVFAGGTLTARRVR